MNRKLKSEKYEKSTWRFHPRILAFVDFCFSPYTCAALEAIIYLFGRKIIA